MAVTPKYPDVAEEARKQLIAVFNRLNDVPGYCEEFEAAQILIAQAWSRLQVTYDAEVTP